jgi:Asp-tRNA(Asn)/Glu-tRNA(Gln) amidotransferase B subunit
VQFLSFVPRGANKKEYLAVVKELKEDIVKTILETPDEDLAKILKEAGLEGEGAEALVGASKLLKAYKDALPENALAFLSKCTGLAVPEFLNKNVPNNAGTETKKQASGELSKETLEKLDPGVRSLLEKTLAERDQATAKADEALSLAKELKDEKILKEYVEKAEDLPHLPIEVLKFAPIMKALGEEHPVEFAEVWRVLKAADAAIEKSELFKEIGKAGSSESDAEAVVYAKARSMVAKDGDLTLEGAVCKVLDENPELYEKYEDERQKTVKRRGK